MLNSAPDILEPIIKSPITAINPDVSFQTVNVTVHFSNSSGTPLEGGQVSYAFSSFPWQNFGTTNMNGEVSKELLPLRYSFEPYMAKRDNSKTYLKGKEGGSQSNMRRKTKVSIEIQKTLQKTYTD